MVKTGSDIMCIKIPSGVPDAVAEIGSGFVLTRIDELEAVYHMYVDDVKITEMAFVQTYRLLFGKSRISVDIYRMEYCMYANNAFGVRLVNSTDTAYLIFSPIEKRNYACIGCLTKRDIDDIYGGCLKEAVFDAVLSF
jgi:hypothetical protein